MMKKLSWAAFAAAVLLPMAASASSTVVFDPRPHPFDPWNHFRVVEQPDVDRDRYDDRYADRYEYESEQYAPPPVHRKRHHGKRCWWEDRNTRVCDYARR